MCSPTLIVSAIAQGAGAAMQNRAVKDANATKAMMMRQNQEKNRALEDAQRAAIVDATGVADSAAGKQGINNAAVELSDILKSAITGGGQFNKPSAIGGAPRIVEDARAAAVANAIGEAKAKADAVAQLEATSRYLQTTVAPKIADSAAIGGLTGNFMRGNSGVLDTGLQFASSKAYSPMAQILTGAGKTGMAYGLYDRDKVIDPNEGTA